MAVGSLSNSLVHGVVDLFDFLSNGTDSYDLGPVSRLSDWLAACVGIRFGHTNRTMSFFFFLSYLYPEKKKEVEDMA